MKNSNQTESKREERTAKKCNIDEKKINSYYQDENVHNDLGFIDSVSAQLNSTFSNYQNESQFSKLRNTLINQDSNLTNQFKVSQKSVKIKKFYDKGQRLTNIEQERIHLLEKLKGNQKKNSKELSFNQRKKLDALKQGKEFEEETKVETHQLLQKMYDSCMQDYVAINEKQSALNRFQMIDEMTKMLKKKHVQKLFLDMNGCRFLEMWLSINPDNSQPPIQIIECVLQILDSLPITQQHLEQCQVAKAVSIYAACQDDFAPSESIPKDIISQATKLLQKWQTVVYQLSYEYDKDGFYEQKQRDLRQRLEVLRDIDYQQKNRQRLKDDEFAFHQDIQEDELIKKTPNGFIMLKQNFDWLEKPLSSVDPDSIKANSFKQQLKTVIKNQKQLRIRSFTQK